MNTFDRPKTENEKFNCFSNFSRKPLICSICDNYYNNPCLLSCYHSYCSQCLENKINNGIIYCPQCGSQTQFNNNMLPYDSLLKKLIELFDMDNPPCTNCDKRDRSSMFFCSTCNQALCGICRENTHRAKMFSSHEITSISKFSQEGLKKCSIHGEPFLMYSLLQKNLLCVNCFRDLPNESRQHCTDIDTAYTQAVIKLESVITNVCETQNLVREGITLCKTYLDELLHNTDTEKMTVHSFTQGLQEAINKTESTILVDIQRQYEMKEHSFRNQLLSLSTVLPILQQHILLCQSFSSTANKFQFLEVAFSMIDRLNTVAGLPRLIKPSLSSQIKTNYRSEFAHCLEPWVGRLLASSVQQTQESVYETSVSSKYQNTQVTSSTIGPFSYKQRSTLKFKALEGEGPFPNHCRSFNNQVKELNTLMKSVRDRLGELRKDVTILHKSATPPLVLRHQVIVHDCARLNDTLDHIYIELEGLKAVFKSIWQEQLYRINIEQDIFQQQMTDIGSLRGEVKQLTVAAQNLEPYVTQFSSYGDNEEIVKLKSLLNEISQLKEPLRLRYDRDAKSDKVLSRRSRCQSSVSLSGDQKTTTEEEVKRDGLSREERTYSVSEQKNSRGMFLQFFDKVRSKEKSSAVDQFKIRSKSEDRLKECTNQSCQKVYTTCSEGSVPIKPKRSCSLYHSYGSYKTCNTPKGTCTSEQCDFDKNCKLSRNNSQIQNQDCDKYAQFLWKETTIFKGPDKKESDYQSISEATSIFQSRNNKCYSSIEDYCQTEKKLKPAKKGGPPSPPPRIITRHKKCHKKYPNSDTEESTFFANAVTTRSQSGNSVTKNGKAVFLLIGSTKNKTEKCFKKQRSWETFPPKKKLEDVSSMPFKNPENYKSQFDVATLQAESVKKSDSFEGHEEAVSSLVREFQKVRMLEKQKQAISAVDKDNV